MLRICDLSRLRVEQVENIGTDSDRESEEKCVDDTDRGRCVSYARTRRQDSEKKTNA
jgi:hypothetical protein